jgi:PhzF family phenazine biosynthesis protein
LLLKVAAENNLSETAFFLARGNQYELRWFTPQCEVQLCGHATLASAYVLLHLLNSELQTVRFETRHSGSLTVHRDGDLLSMDFPAMFPTELTSPPEPLMRALGPAAQPSVVLEANDTYIVVYESESEVQSIRPDFQRMKQLHPFAVAVTSPGDGVDFVSRYFAPSYGIPEDPVTGSAHCALTPYWTKRLGKTQLHARQVSERGGELWCEQAGERVILKGAAVLTLEGTLQI